MKTRSLQSFTVQFGRLSIATTPVRPLSSILCHTAPLTSTLNNDPKLNRPFSSTAVNAGNWLLPTMPEKKRSRKGRPRVPTGGSARGTTLVWGDYGLRMCDHHRRVSAQQLKIGEDAIKLRLKGMRYRLYKRVCANIGVYSSGNEVGLTNLSFGKRGQ
ncbi:39S ribosomal protein L16, mitochondrial [Clarireedia jacksonii]